MAYLYDIVILTDQRYVNPAVRDDYIANLLLEDRLVAEALQAHGLRVGRQGWDNPDFDWRTTRIALFRTTWDYFNRFAEFRSWFARAREQTQLINRPGLIDWNLDKRYLLDLQQQGIRIVPTTLLEAGSRHDLAQFVVQLGWPEAILKPAVSGAARHTYRFTAQEAPRYQQLFDQLLAREALLLQPFQPSVLQWGEVALMFFGEHYSHAIRKMAKPGDFRVQDDFGGTVTPYQPNSAEIDLATQAIRACPQVPVYGRVDLINDNKGRPQVSEVELIEPELWLRYKPKAAQRLAARLVETARQHNWLEQ